MPTGCEAACDALLRNTQPQLMFAVERPGVNARGVHHGLGGRPLTGLVADLDGLFLKARELEHSLHRLRRRGQ